MNFNQDRQYNSYKFTNKFIEFPFLKKYIIGINDANLAISAIEYDFPLYLKHRNTIFSIIKSASELINHFKFIRPFSLHYYKNNAFYLQRAIEKCNKICIDFYFNNNQLYIINSYDIIIQYLNKNIFMKTPSNLFIEHQESLHKRLVKYLKIINYKYFGRIEFIYANSEFYLYNIKQTQLYAIKYYEYDLLDDKYLIFDLFYNGSSTSTTKQSTKYICNQYDYQIEKQYYFDHDKTFLKNKRTQIITSISELTEDNFFTKLIRKHSNSTRFNLIGLMDNYKYCEVEINKKHRIVTNINALDDLNYKIGNSILNTNNNYAIELNNDVIKIQFYCDTTVCISGYINSISLGCAGKKTNQTISVKYGNILIVDNTNNSNGNICYIIFADNPLVNMEFIKNKQ